MSHNCSSILFHCMDFRLTDRIREYMKAEGLLGDSDVVSLAGSAKEIVDGTPEARALMLKQIKISNDLHSACRVILMHHTRCGAYAAAYNFTSLEEERRQHEADLEQAAVIIKAEFPGLEVVKMIAEMVDDRGEEVMFVKL